MRQREFAEESLIATSFLDRVEVGSLQIFDECEHEQRLVVEVANDSRYILPVEVPDRAEPPLARNQLVAVALTPNGNGLEQAIGANRSFQLGERRWLELTSRLEWVRPDSRRRYPLELG
jgi:hypothetical protein